MNQPNLSALLLTFKSHYMKPVISAHRNMFQDFTDFRLERYFYLRCDQPKSFIYQSYDQLRAG